MMIIYQKILFYTLPSFLPKTDLLLSHPVKDMENSLPGDILNYSAGNVNDGGQWYFSRKEIEDNSPSRRDSIDLKKEVYLRKSYCTYLQDLGMRLLLPQQTIATAITFCHRFFLRQSHAKNDRRTIATACMFLAGKVEETPRQLKDVILVSYEIIQKKDPEAVQKIKQTLLYEQQKEKILIGERVVLATLGFDLNVKHPYKPLMDAISKFVVDQKALRTVAWNFVNDGLRTSLCLQFKPHHIAAGAIFLAAKFLKVKLPSGGEKVWWHEFDVQPRQLEEVSNQMLELYEQNRLPPSISNEAELVTRQVTPKYSCGKEGNFGRNSANREGTFGQLPQGTFGKIDKDKVKAALEKRKKSRGDVTRKTNFLDEDDLIERELEAGIELAAESENNRRQEHEKHQADAGDGAQQGMEEHLNDIDNSFHSPKPNNRKRKV